MSKSYEIGSGEPWPPEEVTNTKPNQDWRAIPLDKIEWFLNGVSKTRHIGHVLYRLTNKTGDGPYETGDWHGWTLGQLADAGESRWARTAGIGRIGILIIKEIIDRAAAGENVMTVNTDGYVPQPWPRTEDALSPQPPKEEK